jgi:hypothetical protein
LGGLVVDGKLHSIAERMKHYNVTGLSVVVIDNYQIVWAKGYGYADKKEDMKVTLLFERCTLRCNTSSMYSIAPQHLESNHLNYSSTTI